MSSLVPGSYVFLTPFRDSKGGYLGLNGKKLDTDTIKIKIGEPVMYVTEREYNWLSVHPFIKEHKQPLLVLKPR